MSSGQSRTRRADPSMVVRALALGFLTALASAQVGVDQIVISAKDDAQRGLNAVWKPEVAGGTAARDLVE